MKTLLLLLSIPAFAAISNVAVSPTHNVAIFTYVAPTSATCTVKVSTESDYTPLVNDVNSTLYTGAGTDAGGGRARSYVVGKMSVETALDGLNYSRSLQTNTLYYYEITCGGDTSTGIFHTRNLPLGITYVPNQQINGDTGKWLQPSVSYTDRTQEFIDPITGTLLKRLVMPRDAIYEYGFNYATSGSGAAWTTPNNVAGSPDGSFATYSGTAQAKLVVALYTSGPPALPYNGLGFDFISVEITGFGSGGSGPLRTTQMCISTDQSTCAGDIVDTALPASNGLAYYNQAQTLQVLMGTQLDPAYMVQFTGAYLLLWKKETSGADTISLDAVAVKWGSSIRGQATAGGFHDMCGIRDSGGWFKCVVSGQLYAINAFSGESRNMGTFGIFFPPFSDCFSFGGGSRLFSTTDPNQFYCGFWRGTMDATNTAKAGGTDVYMDSSNLTYILPATTPTFETLLHQFDPTLPDNWFCQPDAVQGVYIIGACRAGQQDSYAYTWSFSLGNNTSMDDVSCGTIANGKCSMSGVGIAAVNKIWTSPVSRYVVFHTIHSQGPVDVQAYESQYAQGNHMWGNTPVAVTLGNNMDATQTNVTVSSAWITGPQARTGTLSSSGLGVSFAGVGYSIEYGTTLGDSICAAGQCRTVTYIFSTTGVNIDTPFSPELTGEAWTNEWSAAPGDYVAGEPVSAKMPHYLGPTIVGDYFVVGSESMRIVTKNSPTSWTVARGCSYFEAVCSGTGASHTAGDNMTPQGIGGSFGEGFVYYWDFVADPTASDSNAGDPSNSGNHTLAGIRAPNGFSGSHQTSRGKCLIAAGYDVMCVENGMDDRISWGKPSNYPLSEATGWGFNGRYAQNAGNTYQRHPSNQQMGFCVDYVLSDNECNFFTDYTPFVGGSAWVAPGTPSTNVDGNVWKLGLPDGNGSPLVEADIKSMPIMAINGQKALKDISGPNSLISTSTDRFEWCFALVAGECRDAESAGGISAPGDIFFNAPGLNQAYCVGGESYIGNNDICIGNQTADGNATVQFSLPIPPTSSTVISEHGLRLRTLGKVFAQPRYGSSNTKVILDGSWMFHPGVHDGSADMWLLKNPGMPPLDSITRNNFVPVNVQIPTFAGADNAYIEFGYQEFGGTFRCTTREENCVAAASNAPFWYLGQSWSGVSCASGCNINVPGLPSRAMRYQIVWRNSTTVVRRSPPYFVAVP